MQRFCTDLRSSHGEVVKFTLNYIKRLTEKWPYKESPSCISAGSGDLSQAEGKEDRSLPLPTEIPRKAATAQPRLPCLFRQNSSEEARLVLDNSRKVDFGNERNLKGRQARGCG